MFEGMENTKNLEKKRKFGEVKGQTEERSEKDETPQPKLVFEKLYALTNNAEPGDASNPQGITPDDSECRSINQRIKRFKRQPDQ